MTLTVRLDPPLEAALERYCTSTGVTKSLVVQESLARYLTSAQALAAGKGAASADPAAAAPVSANYRAFQEAGLIGAVAVGQSADKAGVRARMAQALAERKARGGDAG
jgi:predicted transcriptional regulator